MWIGLKSAVSGVIPVGNCVKVIHIDTTLGGIGLCGARRKWRNYRSVMICKLNPEMARTHIPGTTSHTTFTFRTGTYGERCSSHQHGNRFVFHCLAYLVVKK